MVVGLGISVLAVQTPFHRSNSVKPPRPLVATTAFTFIPSLPLLEQLDDFGVALVVSVGRHQAFEFFKPVLDDVDWRR